MAHGMADRHRNIIDESGHFILQNFYPEERFWSLVKGKIFDEEALQNIKSKPTNIKRVAELLDRLPKRGHNAFDQFCMALVKSDNYHIAEALINNEVEHLFGADIRAYDGSERSLSLAIKRIKNHAERLSWLTQMKHEVVNDDLSGLADELEQSKQEKNELENVVRKLETDIKILQHDIRETDKYLAHYADLSSAMAKTVKGIMEKDVLNEIREQINEMKAWVKSGRSSEVVNTFCGNMKIILDYQQNNRCPSKYLESIDIEEEGIIIEGYALSSKLATLCDEAAKLSSNGQDEQTGLTLFHKVCDLRTDVNAIAKVLRQLIVLSSQVKDEAFAGQFSLSEVDHISKQIHLGLERIAVIEKDIMKYKSSRPNKMRIAKMKDTRKEQQEHVDRCKMKELYHRNLTNKHMENIVELFSSVQLKGLRSRPNSTELIREGSDILTVSWKGLSDVEDKQRDAQVQFPDCEEIYIVERKQVDATVQVPECEPIEHVINRNATVNTPRANIVSPDIKGTSKQIQKRRIGPHRARMAPSNYTAKGRRLDPQEKAYKRISHIPKASITYWPS